MLSRFALADAVISSILVVVMIILIKRYTDVDYNNMKVVLPGAAALVFFVHIIAYHFGLVDFFCQNYTL